MRTYRSVVHRPLWRDAQRRPRSFALICRVWVLALLGLLWPPPAAPVAQAQDDSVTGTVIIAVAADAPPFAAQASNGQLVGFDVDLLKILVRTAGLHVSYEPAPFIQLIPGVATQLYDAAVGCIATTDERRALVDFSDAYFTTGSLFVFSKGSAPIYDLTDLTPETTISTVAESVGWSYLTKQSAAKIITATTSQRILEQAAAHLADAAFVDEISADRYMRTHPEAGLQVVSGLIQPWGCAIAVNQENPRLLLELNAALTRLKNNGKYLTIYRRWFGSRPLTGPRLMTRPAVAVEGQSGATLPLLAADVPFADQVSGTYLVTVLTDPVTYQLVELTTDGQWRESVPVATADSIRGIASLTGGQLAVQQGQWQGVRADPLAATVEISATLVLSDALPTAEPTPLVAPARRTYILAISDDGQLHGAYTLYTTAVPTATLSGDQSTVSTVTVGITATVPMTTVIELTGQRVVE